MIHFQHKPNKLCNYSGHENDHYFYPILRHLRGPLIEDPFFKTMDSRSDTSGMT